MEFQRRPKHCIWYVAEDSICVYEAKDKRDAESYMAFLLRNPQIRKEKA